MELKQKQMTEITGGAITSSWINAISKAINTVYNLGKYVGSAIRRFVTKTYCPVK